MLDDKELLSSFTAGIQQVPYSSSEADRFADETVVCSMYNVVVVKMLNTINNDFVKSLSILDPNFLQQKDRSKLRDKLKGLAAETQ